MNERRNREVKLWRCAAAWLLLAAVCLAAPARAQQRAVDQILVLVNDEVITRSDVLWALALDPDAPSPAGQVSSDVLKRKLDVMIDAKLVEQEAQRIPGARVTAEEVAKRRTELIARFPSEAAFRQRVESVGLTAERIDRLIRQRIQIERFVDFRFNSFVFISEPEVERYYEEVLAPSVRERGQVPPPLDQVRDRIVEILKAERVNQEIDRWLLETRQRADIVQLAEP